MKEIRDAVERLKQSEISEAREIKTLLNLAKKVLAVKGLPEKKECICSKQIIDAWGCDCGADVYNYAIDQCTLAITGALLSEEETEKALNQSWYENYGDPKHPYSIELADAIHKAQMEKLGGTQETEEVPCVGTLDGEYRFCNVDKNNRLLVFSAI